MCIGIPMQVIEAQAGRARVAAGDERHSVDTRLVGECRAGEWLLVFQGAAREKLEPDRAAEICATLELLRLAMSGDAQGAAGEAAFRLPSQMSAADVAALATPPLAQGPSA